MCDVRARRKGRAVCLQFQRVEVGEKRRKAAVFACAFCVLCFFPFPCITSFCALPVNPNLAQEPGGKVDARGACRFPFAQSVASLFSLYFCAVEYAHGVYPLPKIFKDKFFQVYFPLTERD